ncbi:MAG: hypothetical protein ABIH80_03435 [Methanobacteriota archaeon]
MAYHGSWSRNEATGYKIVSIDMQDLTVKDFAAGWLTGGNVLGRPRWISSLPMTARYSLAMIMRGKYTGYRTEVHRYTK